MIRYSTRFDLSMAHRDRFSLASALEKLEEEFKLAEKDYNVDCGEQHVHSLSDNEAEDLELLCSSSTEAEGRLRVLEEERVAEDTNKEEIRLNESTESSGMLESESYVGSLEPMFTECECITVSGSRFEDKEEEGPSSDVLEPMSTEGEDTPIERSFEDKEEEEAIRRFVELTCGCNLGPKKTPCSNQLSLSTISQTRNNCLQLTRSELDLVIMAQVNAFRTSAVDKPSTYRGKSDTFRPYTGYSMHGLRICRKTFSFLHTVGKERMENLCSTVDKDGVVGRVHGNSKLPRHNKISYTEVSRVRDFIQNVASVHGLPLPGRLPNQEDKVILLPSDMPKSAIYRDYKVACTRIPVIPVGKTTFYNLWKSFLPSIGTMKPSSDLCFECQQNIASIIRSAHLSEDEKSDRLRLAESHLTLAKTERGWYNKQIEDCKAESNYDEETHQPRLMHYSFDYAQQVHFPNDPQQPGPAYFLSARKCQIFGICCEPLGKQVNYLIDEEEVIGKGANATVSLLHHYLCAHAQQEDHLLLHADNCIGQNKNNCLIHYLLYLILMGKKKSVILSFMLSGHTKFAPDRHFGLIKKAYRRTRVDTMGCIARLVEQSSVVGANSAQLVHNSKGERVVHFYEWSQFLLQYFKAIPGITSYHVFRFDCLHPGTVFVREHSQSPEKSVTILKGAHPDRGDHPTEILPKGLDLARQWYLYEKIRPFCSSNLSADISCPKPLLPKPSDNPSIGTSNISNTVNSAGTKRRQCSLCKGEGHTKRTCPNSVV